MDIKNINLTHRKKRRLIALGVLTLIVIGAAFLVKTLVGNTSVAGSSDKRVSIDNAKKSMNLNRDFSFPLKDEKGKEVSRVRMTLTTAELRDEIIVKGKKATSVKGRTFLIINMKLTNEYERSVEINTGDYVRLSVNGNEKEWLAPDIHNDPVLVSAISTENTRIGFAINDTDKNIKIRVGEVSGEKTTIDINF